MEAQIVKIKVQRWIVFISIILLIGKFIAFFLTNSVGILTDAFESIANVTAAAITLYSIIKASYPRDRKHPFGYGKIELLSATLEGTLIFIAGLWMMYEGGKRLFNPVPLQKLDIGIIIIALAGLANYIMGWYCIKTGKRFDSLALLAGGKHLQSDTYSSIGLVTGLLLVYWTGLYWIDSVLALIFGGLIIYTGIDILRKTLANLMDKADETILKTILQGLQVRRKEDWIDIHNMKVLKYGNSYFINCAVTLPWYYTVSQAREICKEIKRAISEKMDNRIKLNIHAAPCNFSNCENCILSTCEERESPFIKLNVFSLESIIRDKEYVYK